jgi:hypothetical protein
VPPCISLSENKAIIMRTVIAIALFLSGVAANGQNVQLKGGVLDEKGEPLTSVAAVLLNPADSTLLYFGISGKDGRFEITNIKRGTYVLQVSFVGYTSIYKNLTLPLSQGEDLGTMIMVPKVVKMGEVVVTGERIPIRLKGDTIEYDAKAFKVKTDGVAEDLLKKMPGLEIDRAGNIKAMGEDVQNVLVDGKEFFGNNPKVATRNLPADAINKVQLFDKPTDESKFTGIDDGVRNQTLNLVLDPNKKKGVFGDVMTGGGTGEHFQANGKVYRFTEKSQFAALGMFNNINQYGFSVGDFINFNGGISAMSGGSGRIVLGSESSYPVNFGQPVYGSGSNGAAGINYSYFPSKDNRYFVSYLGNGSSRNLSESSTTKYFTPAGSYNTNELKNEIKRDTAHRVNFGVRRLIGQKQNLIVNGGISYNSASNPLSSTSESFANDVQANSNERASGAITSRLSGNVDASYLWKINEGKTIFRLSGNGNYSGGRSDTRFLNRTEFLNPYNIQNINQFYNLRSVAANYSGSVSITQKISKQSFIDLGLKGGYSSENLLRRQGDITSGLLPIDTLSPDFGKYEKFIQPGLAWKLSTIKSQLTLGLTASAGEFNSILNSDTGNKQNYFYLNPRLSWEFEYRTGRRLMFDYSTSVNTPSASQLLPVVINVNSLSLFYGNRNLKPEYIHNARAIWMLFDQFSFTTLITGVNVMYTQDKINYSRIVDSNLGQQISLINVRDDWNAGANVDFSTPIKPLGIKVNLSLSEDYNKGISLINKTENVNKSFLHRISLTLENRKKDKWDIETGGAVNITDSKYSVQKTLNNIYQDFSWFSEISYTPGVHFNFRTTADITSYSARTFSEAQLIPLIGAEVSYYFLKNQRGVLSLGGVDLLNRNKGIERTSELNNIVERRSDIIGRYVMLSFKYRLNKMSDTKGGIDVKIRNRH